MAENKNILLQSAMTAGLYLGLFWVVRYLFFMFSSGSIFLNFFYLFFYFMPFSLGIVFVATRWFRKISMGSISFLQAWTFGVLVYFFASLIVAIPQYIYYQYMVPVDFLADAMENAKELIQKMNVNPDTLERLNNMTAPTPIGMVLYDITGNLFQGFIFSLPIAAFISSSKNSSSGINS